MLNNSFKAIFKYILPDELRIALAINENLDHSKSKLIENFKYSKFNKEEKAKKVSLNKYEMKIAESNASGLILKTLKEFKDIFKEMYSDWHKIIHDLIKVQHDISNLYNKTNDDLDNIHQALNINHLIPIAKDWAKFRSEEFISDYDVWKIDRNSKITGII